MMNVVRKNIKQPVNFSLVIWLMFVLPIVVIILSANRLPFGDTWDAIIPLYFKLLNHSLDWHSLWVPHNEHRLVLTRLIYLTSYRWFGAYPLLVIGLSYVIYLCCFFALTLYLNRQSTLSLTQYTLLALLCFPMGNYDIWQSPILIQFPLTLLFFTTSVFCLRHDISWQRWLACCLLSTLSTLSSANGLLVWPLCFILSVAYRNKWQYTLSYLVLGIVVISLYLHGNHSQGMHWDMPKASLKYFLMFLGNPLGFHLGTLPAKIIGATACLLYITLIIYNVKQSDITLKNRLYPWLTIGLFTLINAATSAVTRVQFGSDQSFSSRYQSLSVLLYIALFCCFILLWPRLRPLQKKIIKGMAIVFFTLLLIEQVLFIYYYATQRHYRAQAIAFPYHVLLPQDKSAYPTGNHVIEQRLQHYYSSAINALPSAQPNYLDKVLTDKQRAQFGQVFNHQQFTLHYGKPPQKKDFNYRVGTAITGKFKTVPNTRSKALLLLSANQQVIGIAFRYRQQFTGFVVNQDQINSILVLSNKHRIRQAVIASL